ncbi:hypothetical protein HYX14_04295 [Candidatus Woesearchaeota archaeon]|nr:hypothetical protein [Candidatus Woesearchaeota archaeon]
MNEQKVRGELALLNQKLQDTSSFLRDNDRQRLKCLGEFLGTKELEKDAVRYTKFIRLNGASLLAIKGFTDTYEKMMAYVLLLEPEGHKTAAFQGLLVRYRFMEQRIKIIEKLRRRQSKLMSSMMRRGAAAKFFSVNFLRTITEHLLKRTIRKEYLLMLAVIAIAQRNEDEVRRIQAMVRREEKKQKAYTAVAGMAWLAPLVGNALFLVAALTLSWFNETTENYKNLMEILEQ